MNRVKLTLEIARWEFLRWFKVRGQLLTLLASLVLSLAFAGGGYLLERSAKKPVKIIVLNEANLPLASPAGSRLNLSPADGRDEATLREIVYRREADGLLIMRDRDAGDLVVATNPIWLSELQQYLTGESRRLKLKALEVSPEQLADAATAFKVNVVYQGDASKPSTKTERIAAGVLIALMMVGIVFSLGGQLASITGEKQLRVTEQILSAVTPQQWIDGKILGVSLYSAVQTLVLAVSALIFIGVAQLLGQTLEIPLQFANPGVLLVLVLFSLGGFLFWNAFLAAVASTLTDPNASSKVGFLFMPFFASLAISIAALKHPEGIVTRVFALLPVTSPVVLPLRAVLTKVPLWEIVVSLGLLIGAIWLIRTAAGRIFRIGMLMYGKEPSWREMLRWARES